MGCNRAMYNLTEVAHNSVKLVSEYMHLNMCIVTLNCPRYSACDIVTLNCPQYGACDMGACDIVTLNCPQYGACDIVIIVLSMMLVTS